MMLSSRKPPLLGLPPENSRRRVEAVVIFRGIEEILIVARLRSEGERRRDVVIGIEFQRIVFGVVARIDLGFDIAQISAIAWCWHRD